MSQHTPIPEAVTQPVLSQPTDDAANPALTTSNQPHEQPTTSPSQELLSAGPGQSSRSVTSSGKLDNIISQYQTEIVPNPSGDITALPSKSTMNINSKPAASKNGRRNQNKTAAPPKKTDNAVDQEGAQGANPVNTFQTTFSLQPLLAPKEVAPPPGSDQKQATFSKASISSLINLDESNSNTTAQAKNEQSQEKKKRAAPKTEGANKKAKVDTGKKGAKAENKGTELKKDAKAETKKTVKTDSKTESKKTSKAKKKTPEIVVPSQDKPAIHPTMTTDKSKTPQPTINLPGASFREPKESEPLNGMLGLQQEEKEARLPPVISLDIPLLDPENPKPGQAEVIVNVLKLAEEKYGWNVIHPEARSAFELMDDIVDDDDDAMDEEEDEPNTDNDKTNSTIKKKEDQTKKKKQTPKVNRKIGKYDVEDPFIDDAELQWEEEISTTKEGFFVFWGPLVDEKASSKKSGSKSKK